MIIKRNQLKAAVIDSSIPNEDGSFSATFSSDTPGRRPYGIEVVKHDPGCVNLDHAGNGLPLLWNHDGDKVIGRAENVRIDPSDKRGKCSIRFFSDPDSQKVADMVRQGHDCISYRYSIDDYKVDKTQTPLLVNITKSTVKEISVVGVPFDLTVGINKGADDGETFELDIEDIKTDDEAAVIDVEPPVDLEPAEKSEVLIETKSGESAPLPPQPLTEVNHMTPEERKALLNLSGFAQKNDCVKELDELSSGDNSLEAIKSGLMDVIAGRNKPVSNMQPEVAAEIRKNWSFSRAILAEATKDWSDAGFERECQKALEGRQTGFKGGLIVPHEAFMPRGLEATKAADPNVFAISGAGSAFGFTQYGGFVEMLRPKCLLTANGAEVIPGLSANYELVCETGQPLTYWQGENTGTDVPTSVDTLTTKTLSPHQLMAMTKFSRQQLAQSPLAFDSWIQGLILREMALAFEQAGWGNYISGNALTALAGAPTKGIFLDSGVPVIALGTNGGNISTNAAKVKAMKTKLNVNNALAGWNPLFFGTPNIEGVLEATVPPGLTYASAPYWADGKLDNFKAFGTNNLPVGLTKGTANGTCESLALGDPAHLVYGVFGDLVLTVDPYTLAGQGQYRLIANQMVDCALRRSTGFVVMTDAIPA